MPACRFEAKSLLDDLQNAVETKDTIGPALEDACDMADSLDKQKRLNLLLSQAAKLEVSGAEVDRAKEELKSVTAQLEIIQALTDAQRKQEVEQLEHAIARAEAASFRGALLAETKTTLAEVQARIAVLADLEEAIQMKDEDCLVAALEDAVEKGIPSDDDTYVHAEAALRKLRKPPAQPSRVRSKTFVTRMEANTKLFNFQKYPGLHARKHAPNTHFGNKPIEHPMTRLDDDLERVAVAQYLNILGFVGERAMNYPTMLGP